jgi:hypothetical protein
MEIFKRLTIEKLDDISVLIYNKHFNFNYMSIMALKKENQKDYRYLGGLQCEYSDDTKEYKEIESYLIKLAESVLSIK